MEIDRDFIYCSYCFHRLHMLPSEYAELKGNEKAMVFAFIEEKLRQEEEERKKLKSLQS